MNDWQPIETAPKDGTRFLSCRIGYQVTICSWEALPEHSFSWCKTRAQWRNQDKEDFPDDAAWIDDWTGTDYEPTHWMPLPEPPK